MNERYKSKASAFAAKVRGYREELDKRPMLEMNGAAEGSIQVFVTNAGQLGIRATLGGTTVPIILNEPELYMLMDWLDQTFEEGD